MGIQGKSMRLDQMMTWATWGKWAGHINGQMSHAYFQLQGKSLIELKYCGKLLLFLLWGSSEKPHGMEITSAIWANWYKYVLLIIYNIPWLNDYDIAYKNNIPK